MRPVGTMFDSLNSGIATPILSKTDKYGNMLWLKRYPHDTIRTYAQDLVLTSDGGMIIACGILTSSGGFKILFFRTDVLGNLLWSKSFGNSSDNSWNNNIITANDGNFLICGSYNSYALLFKIDTNGNMLWTKTYNGGGFLRMKEINNNGDIIIVGGNVNGNTWILKLNSNGNIIWSKEYAIQNPKMLQPFYIDYTSEGDIIVAGYYFPYLGGWWFPFLIKVDGNGKIKWTKIYRGPWMVSECYGLKATIDSGYVLCLEPEYYCGGGGGPNVSQLELLKTDKNGNPQWSTIYGACDYRFFPSSMIETNDRGFAIVGVPPFPLGGVVMPFMIKTDKLGKTGCTIDPSVSITVVDTFLTVNSFGSSSNTGGSIFPDTLSQFNVSVATTKICGDSIEYVPPPPPPLPVIDIDSIIYIPNAFSPNGDGSNDFLFVMGNHIKEMKFVIYNRWYEKVFETTDQKIGWNGAYNGSILNTAVFIYFLTGTKDNGEGFYKKGNISLIR